MVEQIKTDYRQADLDDKTRALFDFAVDVTRRAEAIDQARIDQLRAVGWQDDEILTATQVIGFFNYYTRLADALGVDPEPEWEGSE